MQWSASLTKLQQKPPPEVFKHCTSESIWSSSMHSTQSNFFLCTAWQLLIGCCRSNWDCDNLNHTETSLHGRFCMFLWNISHGSFYLFNVRDLKTNLYLSLWPWHAFWNSQNNFTRSRCQKAAYSILCYKMSNKHSIYAHIRCFRMASIWTGIENLCFLIHWSYSSRCSRTLIMLVDVTWFTTLLA